MAAEVAEKWGRRSQCGPSIQRRAGARRTDSDERSSTWPLAGGHETHADRGSQRTQ